MTCVRTAAAVLFTFVVAAQTTQLRWNGASVSIADDLSWNCGDYNAACTASPITAGPTDLAETSIADGAVASAVGTGAAMLTMGKRITLNKGRLVLSVKGTKGPSLRLAGATDGQIATFAPASGQGDDITGGVYDFMCNTNWVVENAAGFFVPARAPCSGDILSMVRADDALNANGTAVSRVGSIYAATYPVDLTTLDAYGDPATVPGGVRPTVRAQSLVIRDTATGYTATNPLGCSQAQPSSVATDPAKQDVLDLGTCGVSDEVYFGADSTNGVEGACRSTCPPITIFVDETGASAKLARFGRRKRADGMLVPVFRVIKPGPNELSHGQVMPFVINPEFSDADGEPVDQFHWHLAANIYFEYTDEGGKLHTFRGDHKVEGGVTRVQEDTGMSIAVLAGAAGGGFVFLILVVVFVLFVMKGKSSGGSPKATFSFDNPMYETNNGAAPAGDVATFDAEFDGDGGEGGNADEATYSEPQWADQAGDGGNDDDGGNAEAGYMDVDTPADGGNEGAYMEVETNGFEDAGVSDDAEDSD